ncbi:hypothetical protein TNCV_1353281 [Trichonephila clavipes]|nr:hypothetical protein TNCV_1353281 [Trichonephila clavipes]
MDQLKIWEEQIRRGGSTKDKYTTIDKWTHDRFVEARQSNQQVTTRNLQQWALAAASHFRIWNLKLQRRGSRSSNENTEFDKEK